MEADILNRIKMNYNRFTKTKKRVADYILKNTKPIISMSISELAEKCGTAESSIFRFCQDIGCTGYQDFRLEVAKIVYSADDDVEQMEQTDGVNAIAERLYQKNVNALAETKKLLNPDDITKAVSWMTKANRIAFFGVGASFVSALEGYNRFIRIIPNVIISNDSHTQVANASLLEENDVTIIVSYSGSSKETVNIAKLAKKRNAKVICITHFIKSPLTNYADIVILCGTDERLLQGESLTADIAQLYLVGIIYAEFCSKNRKLVEKNKKIVSEVLLDRQF